MHPPVDQMENCTCSIRASLIVSASNVVDRTTLRRLNDNSCGAFNFWMIEEREKQAGIYVLA